MSSIRIHAWPSATSAKRTLRRATCAVCETPTRLLRGRRPTCALPWTSPVRMRMASTWTSLLPSGWSNGSPTPSRKTLDPKHRFVRLANGRIEPKAFVENDTSIDICRGAPSMSSYRHSITRIRRPWWRGPPNHPESRPPLRRPRCRLGPHPRIAAPPRPVPRRLKRR
jgi:hypothetical protein